MPVPSASPAKPLPRVSEVSRRPRQCNRGIDHSVLRPLKRSTLGSSFQADRGSVRSALINTRSLASKTFVLNDFFKTHNLDFLLLTETWLKPGEYSAFSELLPPGCLFFSTPRATGRGGGLAAVYRESFKCRIITANNYSSFELQLFVIDLSSPVLCVTVYRPPGFNKCFLQEFSEFLSDVVPKFDKLLICGDFNIHVCCAANQLANEFKGLLGSFGLTQFVNAPTHELGHTLDLIISIGLSVSLREIVDTAISDHLPIVFDFVAPPLVKKPVSAARYRRVFTPSTAGDFAAAYSDSQLRADSGMASPLSPDSQLSTFFSTCSDILDTVAPFRLKSTKTKVEPWLNDHTRLLRQQCRQAERRWKKDKLHVSLGWLRDTLAAYQKALKEAKSKYLSSIIANSSNRPRVLFQTIDSVINPRPSVLPDASTATCEEFVTFFTDKVASVRQNIGNIVVSSDYVCAPPTHSAVFEQFESISLSSLSKVVNGLKSTNCPLDVIPAKFLKEVFLSVGPSLLVFINTCLSSGSVPAAFKHAVVRPLLKKTHLDPSVLSNFRPVSHLPFLSKVLEKVVFIQLQTFLEENSVLDKFQSGFRSRHSTESALLKVHNDIALSVDAGSPAVLVLLDLTAAFDTVDHAVLVSRLEQYVGIRGTALQWFSSYLADRTFSVMIGELCSSHASLSCGVPQGSILGPILFSLYMLPLGSIIQRHNLSFHFYADDLQLYLPMKPNGHTAFTKLTDCITEVKQWLARNFLHLNDSKTECILFGTSSMLNASTTDSGSLAPFLKSQVKNLGVTFDSGLNFDKQIKSVVKTSFFQLRLLGKVKPFLSRQDLEKAIHAFISSRLDYCNALFVGLAQSSISRLQLVQNAAARFLTGTSRREHITPVLSSLHWLPVRFRIDFKLLVFVFNAINGRGPSYLSEALTFQDHGRTLRSSGQLLLEVPRSRLKQWGDRSFSVAAPRLWNSLPLDIRTTTDLGLFKSKLKTHFYTKAFSG